MLLQNVSARVWQNVVVQYLIARILNNGCCMRRQPLQDWTERPAAAVAGSNGLNTKFQTDMIIMDFAKAFDTVPHNRLLNKLNSYASTTKHTLGSQTSSSVVNRQLLSVENTRPGPTLFRVYPRARYWGRHSSSYA